MKSFDSQKQGVKTYVITCPKCMDNETRYTGYTIHLENLDDLLDGDKIADLTFTQVTCTFCNFEFYVAPD